MAEEKTNLPATRPERERVSHPIALYDSAMIEQFGRIGNAIALIPGLLKGLDLRDKDSKEIVPANLEQRRGLGFMVAWQAYHHKMDPFAYASAVAIVRGSIVQEGKLVTAILKKYLPPLTWDFSGDGMKREIVITGSRPGDNVIVERRGTVEEWHTKDKNGGINHAWKTMPDSMLLYRGTREWARWYAPEHILGLLTEDEMEDFAEDFAARNATPIEQTIPSAPSRRLAGAAVAAAGGIQAQDSSEMANIANDDWTEDRVAHALASLKTEIETAPTDAALDEIVEQIPDGAPAVIIQNVEVWIDARRKTLEVAREGARLAAETEAANDTARREREAQRKGISETAREPAVESGPSADEQNAADAAAYATAEKAAKAAKTRQSRKKADPAGDTAPDPEQASPPAGEPARGRFDEDEDENPEPSVTPAKVRTKIEGEDAIKAACDPLLAALRGANTVDAVDKVWAETIAPWLAENDIGDWEKDLAAVRDKRKKLIAARTT